MSDTPETAEESGDRDEKGRFLPGHGIRPPPGSVTGRPRIEDQEKLRAGLSKAIGNGSVDKWAKAIRERFERGDMVVTEFIFERLLGKVPQGQQVGIDEDTRRFIAWMMGESGEPGNT